jgi:hypothetical protein
MVDAVTWFVGVGRVVEFGGVVAVVAETGIVGVAESAGEGVGVARLHEEETVAMTTRPMTAMTVPCTSRRLLLPLPT